MLVEGRTVNVPREQGGTVTKALIAEQLFREIGLNRREAKDLIEMLFERISVALQSGEPVKLSGFGNFELREKKERPGRNPKTGRESLIRARRVVTFRPGQKLKLRVRTYVGSES